MLTQKQLMLHRFRPRTSLTSRGDTLVEVLIALAIITAVLAGAFTVSQKSSAQIQDSQERGEALQLLQGQVEVTRALALNQSDDTSGVFQTSPQKYFCINSSNTRNSLAGFADLAINADNFSLYSGCQFGTGSRYNIVNWYDSGTKTFTFRARWEGITGGRNEAKLVYRIYPGKPLSFAGTSLLAYISEDYFAA